MPRTTLKGFSRTDEHTACLRRAGRGSVVPYRVTVWDGLWQAQPKKDKNGASTTCKRRARRQHGRHDNTNHEKGQKGSTTPLRKRRGREGEHDAHECITNEKGDDDEEEGMTLDLHCPFNYHLT